MQQQSKVMTELSKQLGKRSTASLMSESEGSFANDQGESQDDLSWIKLKKALIARYGGRRLENPFEELSALKQTV
ncbi:pentatricopeptide repeat-containing protein, partial [Trifolium pratense]